MFSSSRERWFSPVLIALLFVVVSGCDSDSPAEPQIVADFTFGGEGPVVEYFDASAGPVTQWLWDFGDETSSTLRNPVHEYSPDSFPETYIVRLTVCEIVERRADECSSVQKPVRVSRSGPPV